MSINDNCVEGCDLPSTPNDIKILLKQIKEEVKSLTTETEAKLLLHDGKIAEVCRYIKDNLSNTLRCMFADMEANGELDKIIADTVYQILETNKVDISLFGAIGDGLTDNTTVIQNAINEYNVIYIPKGTYVVDSLTIPSDKILIGEGQEVSILKFTNAKSGLNIGSEASRVRDFSFENIGFIAENTKKLVNIVNSFNGHFKKCRFFNSVGIQNIGLNINSNAQSGYYIYVVECDFSSLETGVVLENQANSNVIERCKFYLCDNGIKMDNSNGNRIINNTIQDYKLNGIIIDNTDSVSRNNGTVIIGNYLEAKSSNSNLVSGVNIMSDLVKSTYLFGNKYNNIRSQSKPEVIDNGQYTTRLEHTNAAPGQEPMTVGAFFRVDKKPLSYKTAYISSKLFGCVQMFADNEGSGTLWLLNRTYNSSNQTYTYAWEEIPLIKNNVLNMSGKTIMNGTIKQYSDGNIKVGTKTSNPEAGVLAYDTSFKSLKMHDGTKFEYLQKCAYDTTANRSKYQGEGFMMFDTTLNKPIWYHNSEWYDASGNVV